MSQAETPSDDARMAFLFPRKGGRNQRSINSPWRHAIAMRNPCLPLAALLVPSMAQQIRMPEVDAQRTAMRKLSFLVAKWSGKKGELLRPCGEIFYTRLALGFLSQEAWLDCYK